MISAERLVAKRLGWIVGVLLGEGSWGKIEVVWNEMPIVYIIYHPDYCMLV